MCHIAHWSSQWHSSKFMPKFHHKTVATVMLNLRVEHMLYRVIDYPGRPDPGFNLTKILRNPYSEIQNASTRATNVIGLETCVKVDCPYMHPGFNRPNLQHPHKCPKSDSDDI